MMEQGPHAIQRELGDWTIEKFEGWDIIERTISREMITYIETLFHDHETAGHPGELKTYNAL